MSTIDNIQENELATINKIVANMERPTPPSIEREWDKFEQIIEKQQKTKRLSYKAISIAASIILELHMELFALAGKCSNQSIECFNP